MDKAWQMSQGRGLRDFTENFTRTGDSGSAIQAWKKKRKQPRPEGWNPEEAFPGLPRRIVDWMRGTNWDSDWRPWAPGGEG